MYAGSKYESHYTVWTAWISIRVRVRVRVYYILQHLAPPGTTVHVPTAGIRANSIHSLRELSHAYYAFQWQWISFWLEIEPPDAERVAVGSRDHSLVSSLKERVSRRNLISQSARPGVDILSRFLNV